MSLTKADVIEGLAGNSGNSPITAALWLLLLLGEPCSNRWLIWFSVLSTSQAADNQFLPDVLGIEAES